MASYLVLTPPGARSDAVEARFIADSFSWVAFLLPAVWLLFKRQWIAGIVVAALQTVVAIFTAEADFMLAGLLTELALRLLVALEGPSFIASRLQARGWTLRDIIPAHDLATAEMMYDVGVARDGSLPGGGAAQPLPGLVAGAGPRGAGFGVFELYGER
ncbi:DUF2628 domain-containing protein [Pararhizobium gei]|uniref:DUF2628 domain-containing protein n=1 Tax=Pararhizobium gei TaxID=1395951 RepID=UPI0023DA3139|nr:DUF2628 domain-containing protein [Rhizobium gei]